MSERSAGAGLPKRLIPWIAGALCVLTGAAASAHPWDDDYYHRRPGPPPPRYWAPPPGPHHHPGWAEGYWWRGDRDGRFGWWWVVDGGWYFYPAPVYPYPAPSYSYYSPAPAAAGGAVAGAIAGGVIGGEMGRGSGAVVGSLLGAFLGMEVGRSIDEGDRMAADAAARRAYLDEPVGRTVTWANPASGHEGTIVTLRDGTDSTGNYCREYQQTVKIDGRSQRAFGTACRRPDGSWQVVR